MVLPLERTSTQTSVIGSQTYIIGRYAPTNGFQFTGNIDELALFNSALSQSDVTSIYNNGEPQSLDAYSPLDWFRMGDNATWNGATWTMTSVGADTRIARSINMVEANRTTDVPTLPFSTKSILLDGVDDYVNVADADNLSFGNGTTDSAFSISAWVKMTDATRFRVVSKLNGSNAEYAFFTSAADQLYFVLYDNTTSNRISRYTSSALTSYEGTWIHLAATYNGSGILRGLKIYLNNTRIDNTTSPM